MRARIVKYGLTIGLVVALAFMVDWPAAFEVLRHARPGWIVAAAGLVAVARLVITWRWSVVLKSFDYAIGFWSLFRVVSAGIGMGSLLPTSAGPDLARGFLLHSHGSAPDTTAPRLGAGRLVSSLLLDRYAATLGTLIVATVGAVAIGRVWLAIGVALGILALLALAYLAARYSVGIIMRVTPGAFRSTIAKIDTLAEQLRHPHVASRGLLPAMLISTLLTLVRVGIFYSLYLAFGHAVPLELALFAIPMLLVVLMVPVTIGGFGLREWLLVISFADAGIPTEVSVSVGIIAFLLQLLVSVPAMLQTLLSKPGAPAVGTG